MTGLSIVIPAYNEEQAIGSIIRRCLAARETIKDGTGINEVEIIVVNDGSQDRTEEIAAQFSDIKLISYPRNRGYGAALKAGFTAAKGEILGFLDADGTCDPVFFRELCRILEEESVDIVIGSRINAQSKMPPTRLLGNIVYALLLGVLSDRSITDTASGMRVLRRSSLFKIYPLPDGMDFTPAMSAKVLFDQELKIAETPMPYDDRIGSSKLRIFSDGTRFLKSIIEVALAYKPARLFSLIAIPLMLIGLLYSIYPIEFYLKHRRLEEWMIYRLITVAMCYLVASILFAACILSERILTIVRGRPRAPLFFLGLTHRLVTPKVLRITAALLLVIAAALNYETVIQYLSTGHIDVHWSRVLIGGFLISAAAHLFVTSVLMRLTDILTQKQRWEATPQASHGEKFLQPSQDELDTPPQ